MDYEIYEGLNRFNKKKTYLVFTEPTPSIFEMQRQANKFFKRSTRHVLLDVGYVIDDELYLEPGDYIHIPEDAQAVCAAYLV